ncbi:hypothetical protein [uncultured Levyella sp.]|uniref:hypothetical protein n=1 Tax=uncultured Levyella sp. TaxID=1715800 RepID=UPI002583D7BA|nr:hypothetical protein [uncultured Levyella sp.]
MEKPANTAKLTIKLENLDEYRKRLNHLANCIGETRKAIESLEAFEFYYSVQKLHQSDASNKGDETHDPSLSY